MAANRKDMRRDDLAIPFFEPEKKSNETDMTSTMSTTLPMMAMFMRNRAIGWAAVVFSIQYWLAETPDQRKKSAQPGYFSVLMGLVAVITTYIPFFLPPGKGGLQASGTGAPEAVPAGVS